MEINEPAAAASAIPRVVSSVSENVRERETYRSVEALHLVCLHAHLSMMRGTKLTPRLN